MRFASSPPNKISDTLLVYKFRIFKNKERQLRIVKTFRNFGTLHKVAVSRLGWSVVQFLLRKPGFNSKPIYLKFVIFNENTV
jgi:hypothetical protein